MNEVKDAVMALLGVDDPVHEPDLPVAPAVEIEVLVCPHCDCPNCEVWSTTEARLATCPECSATFSPPVNESKTKLMIREITECRQRMRRKVSGHQPTKTEFKRFLQ